MKILLLLLFQLGLSSLSAYLISKMSWLGKLGINFFYKEYQILKNPLETGLGIFGTQVLIVFILWLNYRLLSKKATNILAYFFILLAVLGFAYSYYDFHSEFSHKILKSKFHYGVYLIWLGMVVSALFFLFKKGRPQTAREIIEEI